MNLFRSVQLRVVLVCAALVVLLAAVNLILQADIGKFGQLSEIEHQHQLALDNIATREQQLLEAPRQRATGTAETSEPPQLLTELHQLGQQRNRNLQALADLSERRAQLGQQSQRESTRLLVASMVCAALLVAIIVHSVLLPLRRTRLALRQIQEGATAVDLPTVTDDEFGQVALALRQFREYARQLERMAHFDALTGLPNRLRLEKALAHSIPEHERNGMSLALLFMDLDHFKSINDSYGHGFGDEYLKTAADRVHDVLPSGALLFRYSGDEFALLLQHLPRDASLQSRVRTVSNAVLEAVSQPCEILGHSLSMSMSIGAALFPGDVNSADELVSSADAAMYQAKGAGRNQLQFASPELTTSVRKKTFLSGDIRRGIEAGEFEPFFQPILNVAEGRVVCAEVLMRWRHPSRGLVMPGDFVPAAEESGAISALGLSCLDRSFQAMERFAASGRDLQVALNLSSRQLYNSRFVAQVAEIMAHHGVTPGRVEFEITESIMMEQPDDSVRMLRELHALGIGLSIDDFGTGYSSLSYVQRFPVRKIKIDRSFISRLLQSREAEAIVTATLSMARSLKLEVIAEGVETVAQMERLYELGCPLQQGFLFTPALPAPEFEYWLETAPKHLTRIAGR